tara:strand:+ start:1031 stop:1471 length:441 start_codon:yes stop_codon:yes gene_type:complete
MLAVYNIGISSKKGETMKHTNLTIWTKQEELKHIKRELANAKRRHKRQQSNMSEDHDSDLGFIERYGESGINELEELTCSGELDVAYECVMRVRLAHKRAMDIISKYQTQERMNKILDDGRYEKAIEKDIKQLEEEINQLQNEEVA